MRTKRAYQQVLGDFATGKIDILVGTQMVAKGHDFQRVTLVGVVSADAQLSLAGFSRRRAHVSAADAGRRAAPGAATLPGEVLVETYYPEHYAIQLAARQDYLSFFEKELQFRPLAALSAVHGAGEHAGARHEDRKCHPLVAADIRVSRAAGIARRESAGPGGGAAGAAEARVSLPVFAEGAEARAAHSRAGGVAGIQRGKGNSAEGSAGGCRSAEFVLGFCRTGFSLSGFSFELTQLSPTG